MTRKGGALSKVSTMKSTIDPDSSPYTLFSKVDKMFLVIICALGGFYSTIAQTIYFPALTIIERDFNVSEELVNVTVVVYSVCQGIAPMIMGSLADQLGRRPVVLFCIMVYFCACIGIACCQTYGEMIFLRCLQGAGISPVIAINSGIMGDITVKSERGGYVGLTSGFQVLGSALGGLIGAAFTARWGWRSIFWFLSIGSGVTLLLVSVALPETKRSIVGNGSIKPEAIINKSVLLYLPHYKRQLHLDDPNYDTRMENAKFDLLAPFRILKRPEILSLLMVQGLQFTTWICHMTTLSQTLTKSYKLSVSTVGVCFLPAGLCTLTSIVSAGRLLNWNYKRRFENHLAFIKSEKERLLEEHDYDKVLVKELMDADIKYKFDIYKTRLQYVFFPVIVSNVAFIAFGWCIGTKQHLATVLVCSGAGSLMCNCIISISNTLVVDLYPKRSSTAAGCVNFVRCSLTAIMVAALSKMNEKMTIGGTFTFLCSLALVSSILLVIPERYGLKWQLDRDARRIAKDREPQPLDENNMDPEDPKEEEELCALRRAATVQSNVSMM